MTAPGTAQRARAAGLDPTMTLETWEDHDNITYDHDILAELATLRFVENHQCAFILGPVGVGRPTERHLTGATLLTSNRRRRRQDPRRHAGGRH